MVHDWGAHYHSHFDCLGDRRRHFYKNHLGETRLVLFENSSDKGRMSGFTDNYIKVDLPLDSDAINSIQAVLLNAVNADGVMEVLENEVVRG